ncbi:hypothetical protein [Streptomyces himalayensis]|uniref:hypothetical protein n=1 Tax=Streptomyces himalayensis TaxID=2820085 RepID=UPI001C69B47D|nr:hypothetical protein [Streptomyces himalayensis]
MNDSVPGATDVTPETHGDVTHETHETHVADEAVPAEKYEPSGPAPLGVPRTPTGNADVDAQLERLADADHLATDGHLEVYEDVHRGLRDALTALDARPGLPGPPGPPPGPRGPSGPSPSSRLRSSREEPHGSPASYGNTYGHRS